MTTNRSRRRGRAAMLGAVGAMVALTVTPTVTNAEGGGSDPVPMGDGSVIWEWNAVAMDVLTPSGRPLLTQPFVVAAMHVAMYDAVMAIEDYAEPFGVALAAPADASPEAAAAAAAHRVLVGFLPASAATFDAALAASLAEVADGPAEEKGVMVGEAAGWGTLASRLHDGSQSGPVPPMRTPGPGVWAPTPPNTAGLAPWLAQAQPFSLAAPHQFRPDGPPALESHRYERDLDEVRRMGSAVSTERTEDQTTAARFWADQPVAQGQRALRGHAAALGWDLAPTARLFAAVLTSQADAIVACWDAKYHFQFWRPWQSVPTVEPGWTPLLSTPNHPEFPSAHSCLTGVTAHALARVMGTEHIELDVDAVNIGLTRHFTTRDELLADVGNARIWGGLHYRFSVKAGLRIAERVAAYNLNRNFRVLD